MTDEVLWEAVEKKLIFVLKTAFNVASAEVSGGATWGRYDETAVSFAKWHTFALKNAIDKTTNDRLQQIFSDWIKERAPFKELVRRVEAVGVFTRARARLIAMTESTRIHNTVVYVHFQDGGAEGARWDTAVDERVCPICGAIHGRVVKLGSTFPGTAVAYPPAHPGCRCTIRPVMHFADHLPTGAVPEQPPPQYSAFDIKPGELKPIDPDKDAFVNYGHKKYGNASETRARSALKKEICEELSRRTGLPERYISDIIHTWAETSNDFDPGALLIQARAEAVFGARMSTWQRRRFESVFAELDHRYRRFRDRLFSSGSERYSVETILSAITEVLSHTMWCHLDAYRYKASWDELLREVSTKDEVDKLFASLMDFARKNVDSILTEMHKNTVEKLRAIYGKDTITVYRGSDIRQAGVEVGDVFDYEPNALESWSITASVARMFGNFILVAEIPVERFAGSCYSGFGCYNEFEVVLIGNGTADKVRVYKAGS